MKKAIQSLLRKLFEIEIRRTFRNPKEAPIPVVNSHALRLMHFHELVKKIDTVPGNIVECGVGWGRSLYAFCLLEEVNPKGRHIFGFDSFEGFPEPQKEDAPERHGIKAGRYKTNEKSVITHLLASGITQGFIDSQLSLIKGFFNETVKQYNKGEIALLHLDSDLYQSYKDCLEHFYPLVVKGGIIAFDEYQSEDKYPGCKKAVDEYLGGREKILKSDIIDRYYIIKEN